MKVVRRFFEEGDGGGTGVTPATPAPDPKPADPNTPPAEGGKTPPAEGGGAPGENKLPATLEEAHKLLESLTKEKTESGQKLESLSGELTKYKELAGKQSNDVGALRELHKAIANDPVRFAEKILSDRGIKFAIEKPGMKDVSAELEEAMQSGDQEKIKSAVASLRESLTAMVKSDMAQELDVLHQHQIRQKYPDFDNPELTQTRDALMASVIAKQRSSTEVYHLAAQAMNMPQALEAAKEKAKEELRQELEAKYRAGQGGGGTPGDGKTKLDPKDPAYLDSLIGFMNKNRR